MEIVAIGFSSILIASSVYLLNRRFQNIEKQVAKNSITRTNV